ncbi:MAG: biotin--[acetyl-CoA-carboxylase] ligase [Treponema sp.]|nr:biotin--[acetyl-CoA-carboxylase] ligase [Candidatus Treponema merdequi]
MKDIKYIFFTSINSTNTFAMNLVNSTASQKLNLIHKTVVISDKQTNGRGRLERVFYSPEKTGLYMSAIYCPQKPVTDAAIITATAAVAVTRSIKELFKIDTQIKWVNDIYFENKKICGILTEGHFNTDAKCIDSCVIGIGINLSTKYFPIELSSKAGCISEDIDEHKLYYFRDILAKMISDELYSLLENGSDSIDEIMQEYKDKSMLIGKKVEVSPVIGETKENYSALVTDITKTARLVVKTDDGLEKHLDSGEVSLTVF